MQLTNNLIDQDKIITMQQIIDAYRGDKFAKYRVLEKKLLQVKRELKEKNLGTTEKKEKVDAIGALVNAFEQERGQKTGLIHAIKSLAQRLFYTLGTPFSADYREAKKLIIEDLMEYEKEELHCESVPNNKESRFLFDLIYEQRFDTNNEKQCRLMRRKMYNIIHSRSSIHNFYQAFRGLNLKIQREIVDYFLDISDRYKVESTEFEKSHNASNSGEFVAHYVEDRHAYNLLQYIQEQALNGSEIDDNTMEMINKLNADYTRAQRFRRKARYLVWNWGMPDYARGPFITVKSCFGEPVGSLFFSFVTNLFCYDSKKPYSTHWPDFYNKLSEEKKRHFNAAIQKHIMQMYYDNESEYYKDKIKIVDHAYLLKSFLSLHLKTKKDEEKEEIINKHFIDYFSYVLDGNYLLKNKFQFKLIPGFKMQTRFIPASTIKYWYDCIYGLEQKCPEECRFFIHYIIGKYIDYVLRLKSEIIYERTKAKLLEDFAGLSTETLTNVLGYLTADQLPTLKNIVANMLLTKTDREAWNTAIDKVENEVINK